MGPLEDWALAQGSGSWRPDVVQVKGAHGDDGGEREVIQVEVAQIDFSTSSKHQL